MKFKRISYNGVIVKVEKKRTERKVSFNYGINLVVGVRLKTIMKRKKKLLLSLIIINNRWTIDRKSYMEKNEATFYYYY
jgi:hypothetical protein